MPAGPSSTTQQEIYHLLHQDRSRLLGLVQLTAADDAEVQELKQAIALLSSTSLQQNGGGDVHLVVANAVWTRNIPVRADYAAVMLKLFQVRDAEE